MARPNQIDRVQPFLHSAHLAGAIAALLAVLLYAESLEFGYVYDDVEIALQDQRLQEPGYFLQVWWEPWWATSGSIGESRPLTSLSFWAHMQLHGESAALAHAFNVLAFGLLVYLVALAAARWLGREWVAWPVGLLFAAHPVHVEAVANLVGRAEILAGIFSMLAVLCWLKWRSAMGWRHAAAIGLLVLLAGHSKETGYLSAVVLLLGEIGLRRQEGKPIAARPWLIPLVASIGLVAVYAMVQRSVVQQRVVDVYEQELETIDPALNPLVLASFGERLVTPLLLTGKAAQLLFFPLNQSADYSPRQLAPSANPAAPLVMLGGLAAVVWAVTVYRAWRTKSRALGPLLACIVCWIIPSNSVVLIGVMFGERLLMMLSMCLPIAIVGACADLDPIRDAVRIKTLSWVAVGAAIAFVPFMFFYVMLISNVSFDSRFEMKLIGWVLAAGVLTVGAVKRTGATLPALATVAVVAALALATLNYTPCWRSWHTLVLTTAGRHPDNGRFQGELSNVLLEQSIRMDQDLFGAAEDAATRAVELWPVQQTGYVTLACLAQRRGNRPLARRMLAKAKEKDPNLSRFEFLLGYFELNGN